MKEYPFPQNMSSIHEFERLMERELLHTEGEMPNDSSSGRRFFPASTSSYQNTTRTVKQEARRRLDSIESTHEDVHYAEDFIVGETIPFSVYGEPGSFRPILGREDEVMLLLKVREEEYMVESPVTKPHLVRRPPEEHFSMHDFVPHPRVEGFNLTHDGATPLPRFLASEASVEDHIDRHDLALCSTVKDFDHTVQQRKIIKTRMVHVKKMITTRLD